MCFERMLKPNGVVMETCTDPDLGLHAPRAVARPFMVQRWTSVAFVHRPCDPDEMQARLPSGLEVDTFDGAAWVGLIPFRLTIRLPSWAPGIPWLGSTDEVNTRTYVRGPDGRRGIWFLSLDAARLFAVAMARAWYRIPYTWASTRMSRDGEVIRYDSRRRTGSRARMRAALVLGEEVSRPNELDRFLTCRWRLYSPGRHAGGFFVSEIDHEPWPLHRAGLTELDESLVSAAGLGSGGEWKAHFSPGVTVRWARRRSVACPAV